MKITLKATLALLLTLVTLSAFTLWYESQTQLILTNYKVIDDEVINADFKVINLIDEYLGFQLRKILYPIMTINLFALLSLGVYQGVKKWRNLK